LDFSDNIKGICGKESNKAKMGNTRIFSEEKAFGYLKKLAKIW
jgi:hypothetical protein